MPPPESQIDPDSVRTSSLGAEWGRFEEVQVKAIASGWVLDHGDMSAAVKDMQPRLRKGTGRDVGVSHGQDLVLVAPKH